MYRNKLKINGRCKAQFLVLKNIIIFGKNQDIAKCHYVLYFTSFNIIPRNHIELITFSKNVIFLVPFSNMQTV